MSGMTGILRLKRMEVASSLVGPFRRYLPLSRQFLLIPG
jgi:hypothetical protein